ncbi:MAG: hypothetical protein WBA76_00915, partial [Phormidesmis sp.]
FLVILQEDLIAKKRLYIQKVYEFLEIDPTYVPQAINTRPQAVIYSVQRLRVLSWRNRMLYTYSTDRTRLTTKRLFSVGGLIAAGITGLDRSLLTHLYPSKKPVLSEQLKRNLYALYADDINCLEDLIKTDLSVWKLDADPEMPNLELPKPNQLAQRTDETVKIRTA